MRQPKNMELLSDNQTLASEAAVAINGTDEAALISQNELYMSSKVVVTIYSILFVISSIGNTTVFISLVKNRNRKLRINLLILNLTIADLIVTYIMIPMEIGWRITNQWLAGDLMCRIMQAFRYVPWSLLAYPPSLTFSFDSKQSIWTIP